MATDFLVKQGKVMGGVRLVTDADVAHQTDLTNIRETGTTASQAISAGTYFYLNGTLVRAKVDIANGATFTLNTNYEVVTAGALNELNSLKISHIEKTTTIGANSDKTYTLSEILNGTSINIDDVIGVVSYNMRPATSWAEVQAFSCYIGSTHQWGFHNIATGGGAIVDFFVLHR